MNLETKMLFAPLLFKYQDEEKFDQEIQNDPHNFFCLNELMCL